MKKSVFNEIVTKTMVDPVVGLGADKAKESKQARISWSVCHQGTPWLK
jgi:hypothetical protein